MFNVMTFMTTTGYTLYDYSTWPALSQLIVFFMFFLGGMAGSTTGGIKLIRTILVIKYIRAEVTRILHPRGLHHVKIGDNVISDEIVRSTLGFYLFYILIFSICAIAVSFDGVDFISSIAISASSIGNIGPGLGETIGPDGNFSSLSETAKWLLIAGMLIGRLELMAVYILFTLKFWRN